MRTAAVAFLCSTVTAAALTPVVRTLARRHDLLDHALSSRKVHRSPVPRVGGIAIVAAFFAPLAALFFVDTEVGRRFFADSRHAIGLFAGGAIIAALGICDDLCGSRARTKFLVQFGVGALMYAFGFRIDSLANPFGPALQLGILALPFTMLWIAGVINALNLIDGLDGLAGGVALIAVGSTFAVAAFNGEPLMLLFTGALAGSVLGFLFYNFNPATIFMGDTGSMFLGFVLATTAIQTNHKSSTAVALMVPVVALGLPIADTLLAMLRRAIRGVPLFSADRGHIHHRLLHLGLSHRQAVMVLYGACVVLGCAALALSFANSAQTAWFLILLSLASFLGLRRLGFINLGKVGQILEDRRRNLEMQSAVRQVGSSLREAMAPADVWVAVRRGAVAVGASAVSLQADGLSPEELEEFSEGFDTIGTDLLRARYSLLGERPGEEHLELGWDDGRTHVDRDTEIAVELLCQHAALALDRVLYQRDELVRLSLTG